MATVRQSSFPDSRLIFLCGSLRAGTTLTRLLLQQHPAITARGESDFYFDGIAAAGGLAAPGAAAGLIAELGRSRISRAQGIAAPAGGQVAEMVRALASAQAPAEGHLLLTLHRHFDLAAAVFPGAAFVHLVRDPRDVALSAMQMGWAGTAYHGLGPFIDAETSWRRAAPRLENARVVEFSFEGLTDAPELTLRRILAGIGLDFDPAVLDPKGTTYSRPTGRQKDAWRAKISPAEVAAMHHRLASIGIGGDYGLTPATAPSAPLQLQLRIKDVVGRQRFSLERYGLRLWLADHVARRVGPAGFRARIAQAREAVAIQHLK